jgi:hypothetical protein
MASSVVRQVVGNRGDEDDADPSISTNVKTLVDDSPGRGVSASLTAGCVADTPR